MIISLDKPCSDIKCNATDGNTRKGEKQDFFAAIDKLQTFLLNVYHLTACLVLHLNVHARFLLQNVGECGYPNS